MSEVFEEYLHKCGISHTPGPPHSPQLNGVAERTNRTIGNLVRCCLLSARVPKSFWVNALQHCLFSFNSVPCHTLRGFVTPNSILCDQERDLSYLHPLGCMAWYKVPEALRKELDPKGRPSILLAYLPDGRGFLLWDLQSITVVKSRDVVFDDISYPYNSPIQAPSMPVVCELPWPICPAEIQPPLRTPTPDLPLLNIELQPQFDRRLQASIHNPKLAENPLPLLLRIVQVPFLLLPSSRPSNSTPLVQKDART